MYALPRTSLALTVPALALAAALAIASPASDRALTGSVKDALRADAVTKDLSIKVESRNAAVKLSGELDEDEQVVHAVRIARGVTGVREVVNRLTVRGENNAEHGNLG